MQTKSVLVIARHTEAEGVFSYDAYPWGAGRDGDACYVGADYAMGPGKTQRTIAFDIRDDLSWNTMSDCIYDLRYGNFKQSPFETPEIASDDVGQDMLEVALAAAFPEAYSERNRKQDEQDAIERITRNDMEVVNRALEGM